MDSEDRRSNASSALYGDVTLSVSLSFFVRKVGRWWCPRVALLRSRVNTLQAPGPQQVPRKCQEGGHSPERAAQRGSLGGRGGEGERPRGKALQPLVLQVEKLRLRQGNNLPVQGIFCCGQPWISWVLVQTSPSPLERTIYQA